MSTNLLDIIYLFSMRDDGRIQPIPSIMVGKRNLKDCDMAVVIVQPSSAPPVRFRGRAWIKVGPRRAIATPEEERRLAEQRRSMGLTFDLYPLSMTSINDFDIELFEHLYLPNAVAADVLEKNKRNIEDQ